MPTTVARYLGTIYARVKNPITPTMPSEVMARRLRGASEISIFSAEQELLFSVLTQAIDDLALLEREHIDLTMCHDIKSALAHFDPSTPSLWYCKFLGLDPDYVREQLVKAGFITPVKWLVCAKRRVERWNLAPVLIAERSLFTKNHHAYHKGASDRLGKYFDRLTTEHS